jgi:hypothetical protein
VEEEPAGKSRWEVWDDGNEKQIGACHVESVPFAGFDSRF